MREGESCAAKLDPNAKESLAAIARTVPRGSEVLELGPGPGTLTRYLAEERACRVDCIERSPEMVTKAAQHARDVWQDDLNVLDLAQRTGGRLYDLVVTADVLEHLEDPEQVLRQCLDRLRPEGRLALSLPNVGHAAIVLELLDGHFPYASSGILDRTHRWFFTRDGVLALVRDAGFRIDAIEPIVRMPETTEFHHRFDRLSSTMRANLLHHPDALTYQFVVLASPGSATEEEWAAHQARATPASLRFAARVYWAPPRSTTSEDHHVQRFGTLGEDRQRLVFDLPDDEAIGTLRFDPAEGPGFVRLHSIEVHDGDGPVVRLDSPQEVADTVALRGIEALSADDHTSFLMEGEDPFLEIPLPRPLAAGPGRRVVVAMSWPESRDYAAARARLRKAVDLERNLRQNLDDLTERHTEETTTLRAEVAAEHERAGVLQQNLDDLVVRHTEETTTLRAEIAAEHERAGALERTLHEVLHSRGWRLLEWLRRWKPTRR